MNCIIVDANPMTRASIKYLASQVEDLIVVGECSNAVEAYTIMTSLEVDMLFLDAEIPGMTGLELTRRLGDRQPLTIFTSGEDVAPPRFLQSLSRTRWVSNVRTPDTPADKVDFVFIRDNNILRRLIIEDIYFLEAMGDYVKVFTKQKFHAVHTTLRNLEEKLPSNKFLRVHRSYMVALNKVDKIEEGVIEINSKAVPVADAYRGILNKRLNIL